MGNCLESLSRRQEEEETTITATKNEEKTKERTRIKVMLTKEELQWLMEQIEEKGGNRLEELLEEIEKGRKGGKKVVINNDGSWRPSLESITESPEVLDSMSR